MSGFRILPHPKKGYIIMPEAIGFPTPGFIAPSLYSPGIPVVSPSYVMPGYTTPGVYVVASPTAPATTTAVPAATTGVTSAAGVGTATPLSYTVITPPITNIRHLTTPDQDPELRRKVVKHFYNNLKEVYFLSSKFQKLLKYIVVENNIPRLVKSFEELQTNSNNNSDFKLRIKFITDNIFSKYDLEILISKLIAKYSMLYSEDEHNMHWHNAKYRHAKVVKKGIYKKIKYRLQKKVNF